MVMSNFIQRLQRARDAAMGVAERCTRQYELDCWQIALARYDKLQLGNQHLNHGAFDIDLGPDVVKVVRCKECKH